MTALSQIRLPRDTIRKLRRAYPASRSDVQAVSTAVDAALEMPTVMSWIETLLRHARLAQLNDALSRRELAELQAIETAILHRAKGTR